MSYTVIITEEIAANVAVTTQNYPITIEYNATNIADGSTYGNANVAGFMANFGSNSISTTGNVTAGNFAGNGSALTNLTGANVTGTVANATYATTAGTASTATTAGTAGTANVALVAYSVAAANVVGTVAQATQSDYANIANAVAGANVTGTVANAAYATTAGVASYVTANAQANITSVGTLTSLSVTGNVTTSGAFNGNGAVPTGGAADTYLVKDSATDYDYSWTDRVNAKTIYENVKNVSGSTLTKGTPVYQIGVTGNTITVGVARADDPAKLAVGVLDVDLADQAEGRMLVLGEIKGVNTASFATGDEIYLGATGGYTNVKPTSSSVAIQFLGVVNRVDNNNGSGFITGTLVPDAVKYDSYTQTWTGTAWVPTTELSSDASPALGGDLAAGAYNISGTGNVVAGNIIANGQYLTNLTAANISGTVANATYADTAGTATSATTAGTVTTNAQPNITSVGTLAGLTATGNVNLGNVVVNADNIRNVNAWNPNTTPQQARITVGTGYDGDFSNNVDPLLALRGSQLLIATKQTIGNADVNQSGRAGTGIFYADLGGATLTNPNRRLQGFGAALQIGNGTQSLTTGAVYATAAGGGGSISIGNIFLNGVGTFQNTTTSISHGTGALNNVLIGGNATVGNSVATFSQTQFISNNTGNSRTAIGSYSNFTGGSSGQPTPGNVYGFYMSGTTNNHGVPNSNFWRVADNYYFLMNEDDVAQNRLGSLRRYHEFNGVSGTTSGSLTIDKNNGQVQQVNLTGNISSVAFSNFVSSASDSVNTDEQCDTVTIAFNQGSTGGYGVTFPTGSTYKYAGNVTALQSTAANSVSLVSVSALRLSGTTTYLITISPGFV